jgi:hypothetical protein
MNIFASLVFGEFTVAQGETTNTIRIADSPEPIDPLVRSLIEIISLSVEILAIEWPQIEVYWGA